VIDAGLRAFTRWESKMICRVCPTCGMLTPVTVIGKYFAGNGSDERWDFMCYGCGCVLVKRINVGY
jgi:hypothetical protein